MGTTTRPAPRERMLDAATELFYRDGYGVSVETVAERASVAKPTIYAHFASKDALIEALLQRAVDQHFAELDAELERREGDPLARLLAPFDLLVRGLPDPAYHGCLCMNSAATFLSREHPSVRELQALDRRMGETFEQLAAEAGAREPARLARQLMLLYGGIKERGLIDHTGAYAEDARAAAATLLAAVSA